MVRAEKIVDIDENTDVVALAEGVQSSGEAAVLHHDGKPVAKLVPVPAKKRASRIRGKSTSPDDPFWKLIGIGDSGGSDVANFKHEYIAQASEHYKTPEP
jgi:hypothetical protein